ncbi:unnamed protein product, partial [Prorocentrum cordatum]
MAGWAQVACGWVIGALSERWAGSSRPTIAKHLQGTTCQPCPPCPIPLGHYTGLDLCGAAAVGVAEGVNVASAVWLILLWPSVLPARGRALALEGDGVVVDGAGSADPNFEWHHRVLMVKGDAQKWIWLTPDSEVAHTDLSTHRVVALRRAGPFPARHLGNIYAFDAVAPEDMQVLGNGEVFVRRGGVALVKVDDVWLHAVSVADGRTFNSYLSLARGGAGRDPRVVGDERGPRGGRCIKFRDSVRRAKGAAIPGWPLQGKRATREAVLALGDGGQGTWE